MHIRAIERCLGQWPGTEGGTATLINLSENHTFRIDTARGERFVLRVHRVGYHAAAAIRSELEWLDRLGRDTRLPVPRALPGRDGALLQTLPLEGAPRHAVLFAFEAGAEPAPADDLAGLFSTLGQFAALAHRHAASFAPSAGFVRPVWDAEAILGADGPWRSWRQAPHVAGDVAVVLNALDRRLRADLSAYGKGKDRFGLIHADMRLANLLVDGDRVTLIDFDDCGFGWYLYDFAAAISFFEDDPQIPALRQSWLAGYNRIRPLTASDLGMLDAMVLLRRMALLAWIGSHHETELAQAHAPRFAEVTARLAESLLAASNERGDLGLARLEAHIP